VSAVIRLVGALLVAYLILTVWAGGPAAGITLLHHWFNNVGGWLSEWKSSGPAH
jgi:hypothetical protein